jgi:hypothetical protein
MIVLPERMTSDPSAQVERQLDSWAVASFKWLVVRCKNTVWKWKGDDVELKMAPPDELTALGGLPQGGLPPVACLQPAFRIEI